VGFGLDSSRVLLGSPFFNKGIIMEEIKEKQRRRPKVGRLTNCMEVATELARLYRQARWKLLSTADASRLAGILTALRQAYEVADMQRQLQVLKDLLSQPAAASSNVILLKGRDPK
jgi:hypothetical protein